MKKTLLSALVLVLPVLAWAQDSPGSRWGYSVKNSNLPLIKETQFSPEQTRRQEALAKRCQEELRGRDRKQALDCLLNGLRGMETP